MKPKSGAIIGAGPSGLVAAKTLLRSQTSKYNVTIFDSKPEVGGLWAVHPDRPYDGMLNPNMPTNLSRFNIGFSDLAWQSVGIEGHVPYWPRAWQAGMYLRAYAEKFLPRGCLRLGTRVVSVQAEDEKMAASKWRVQWEESRRADGSVGRVEEDVFDHLVVATGYFAESKIPRFETSGIKTTHTTKLRKLEDVVLESNNIEGTVLIVGGGMSGADIATVMASQLSDSLHSPNNDNKKYSKVKLVQLSPEPAYALPLSSPSDKDEPAAPHFLPLDLCFYRLDFKPPGPIKQSIDRQTREFTKSLNDTFHSLVGDQSDLGSTGLLQSDSYKAPYALLTEQYSNFVRSGAIRNLAGRLESLKPCPSAHDAGYPRVQATYSNGKDTSTIEDVVGLVWATGFTPQPSLSFLSDNLRQQLEHDATHHRLPILLDGHATLHSKIPGLAVIGFHEGAFWGSMEMEARFVERRWSAEANGDQAKSNVDPTPEDSTKSLDHLREMRKFMTSKAKDVPQYWMGDYVGLMDELAQLTATPRNDLHFKPQTGPITPARYADSTCDQIEAQKTLDEFSHILEASTSKALFTGRAAFLGLQGDWTIDRTIISHLPTMPSGTLIGKASFHPRFPTDDNTSLYEYLYIEAGTFNMSNGMTMNATRRYVYRYHEETDRVSVWFVRDDGLTVDYMYHGLEIDVESRSDKGWLARADHLCIEDQYDSQYRFHFKGAAVDLLTVTHEVKGPRKDYISTTSYKR